MKTPFYIRLIFLAIVFAISVFFGVHGYLLLEPKWGWELALSTVAILEVVFISVILAYVYSKIGKITALAFGVAALVFSVSLPLISTWEDFQKLDRIVTATIEMTEPEYYSKNVIPALEKELKNAKSVITTRVAEKNRRYNMGEKIYERRLQKDGSIRLITGIEASTWIPWTEDEKAKFKKVDDLTAKITRYREEDKKAKNTFDDKNNTSNANLAGAKSDVKYGLWMFWFKSALIVFLGFASPFYMYSYSNPDEPETDEKQLPIVDKPVPKIKKTKVIKSESQMFVMNKYPDAKGIISDDKLAVNVILSTTGEVIGTAKMAPQAWRNARKNIETKN